MKRQIAPYEIEQFIGSIERDKEYPHYREEIFLRKTRNADRRDKQQTPSSGLRPSIYLWESEWRDVIENAGLTETQAEVMAMRLEGQTLEEIGQRRGHSKQAAMNIYQQAARKVAQAWMEYSYRGLARMYQEDVMRGGMTLRPFAGS